MELLLPFFSSNFYLFFKDRNDFQRLKMIRNKIKNYYYNPNNLLEDKDLSYAFNFTKKYGWTMYPGEYSLKYEEMQIKVHRDSDCGLLYVIHEGKRLYFKRSIIRKEVCA